MTHKHSLANKACWMVLTVLGFLSPAYSAEPDPTVTTPATKAESTVTTTEETRTETKAPVEDRFIPSAQISEDLSVSFPVNI